MKKEYTSTKGNNMKLDIKVKKNLLGYSTRELILVKHKSGGYEVGANLNYKINTGVEGMRFPSLNNFKNWLKLYQNKPELIVKKRG